jgi:hypothetical protein
MSSDVPPNIGLLVSACSSGGAMARLEASASAMREE